MEKTKIAISIFDSHAQEYQEKFMDLSGYHEALDLFCHSLATPEATVLDIACGPGNITRYLLDKHPDLQILGIDLSPKMIELAQKNNPGVAFRVMDIRDISTLNQFFDGILCGFGLPYLSKEEALQLIRDTTGLLRPGGLLYLSTMEDDYTKSGWQGPSSGGDRKMYIHFHQADYLRDTLTENGFEILDLRRKYSLGVNEKSPTDLLIVAKLQVNL